MYYFLSLNEKLSLKFANYGILSYLCIVKMSQGCLIRQLFEEI